MIGSSVSTLRISSEAFVRLNSDGWIFKVGDAEVKLFGDPFSLEGDKELADLLGVTPAEAWKIKSMAFKNYWPKDMQEVRKLFPNIVSEDLNVQLLILSLFSTKLRDPQYRIWGVIIESSNSAGKSHLVKEVLRPLRPLENGELILEFSRLTGAYLERKFKDADLDRKIIYIQEAENAPTQLHLVLSEGKLKIGIVEREDGKFKPIEYEASGTPFIIITSTNWRMNPHLIHRCLIISLDESAEQTFKILRHQTRLASDFLFRERFLSFVAGCEKFFREMWKRTPHGCRGSNSFPTIG